MVTILDPAAVERAVDEVADYLRGDGADLRVVGVRDAVIHVRLDLSNVGCLECVLPGTHLRQLLDDGLRERVAGTFVVVLEDPRE